MKEKIWKLLELLNEYERKVRKKSVLYPVWFYDENIWFHHWNTEYNLNDEYTALIISKKFWFIKWLVENDKIDISKIKCWYVYNDTEEDKVKNVIMNLSISDTPIEDLISYLK